MESESEALTCIAAVSKISRFTEGSDVPRNKKEQDELGRLSSSEGPDHQGI